MDIYLIPSILSIGGNAVLGIYVNIKTPSSKVTSAFTILLAFLMGWAFSETMMRSQSHIETAFFWGRIFYVNGFFLPSAFLALSYVYTGGKKWLYIIASYAVALIFIPFLFSDKFMENMVKIPSWGYDVQVGELYSSFSVLYGVIIAAGTFILIQYYRRSSTMERRRLQFMMAGFLLSVFLVGITNMASRLVDFSLPRTGSLFTLVATISFALGIGRYSLLVIPRREPSSDIVDARCGALCSSCTSYLNGTCSSCELGDPTLRESCPIYVCSLEKDVHCNECNNLFKCTTFKVYNEKCPFSVGWSRLEVHNSYLWEDADPQVAFEIFRDHTIRGYFGLLITRDHPQKVIDKYHLPKVSVVWLSQVEEYEHSIDPTNLPRLTHMVTEFVRQAPISFVLLVGLEYLLVHNEFDKVLKHLHMVNDQVMTNNSRFLVVVDPKTMDSRDLSLLEREMHPLKKDNLFKSPA